MVILSHPTQLFFEGTMFFIVFPVGPVDDCVQLQAFPTLTPTSTTPGLMDASSMECPGTISCGISHSRPSG